MYRTAVTIGKRSLFRTNQIRFVQSGLIYLLHNIRDFTHLGCFVVTSVMFYLLPRKLQEFDVHVWKLSIGDLFLNLTE